MRLAVFVSKEISSCCKRSVALFLQTNQKTLQRRSVSSASGVKKSIDDFEKDSTFNVPPNIAQKVGRNLHLQPNHPLNTIKKIIESYFVKSKSNIPFKTFDNLSPFVTVQSNFDSLLFPKDHEGRRTTDTYYINSQNLLRTHTSAHQVELLQEGHDAFLVTGDVYRRDEIDATHYPVFHQMEGVKAFSPQHLGDKSEEQQLKYIENDLKEMLEGMATSLFGKQIQMRWVDAYFPFTVPSWEMEIFFNDKWLEVLGCGVIHQDILNNAGLGSKRGWAFGVGLERLAMVLFDIPDIRLFWSEDRRFHDQFTSGEIVKFKPYSKYPPCIKDIAFWLPEKGFHPNNLFEVVRSKAGDLVETVTLVDSFTHPKSGRQSNCFRINYRSMDRSLTNEEINTLQEQIRQEVVAKLGVELR